ncbi:MAG TPA: T9SS type A sorting domain-containing protein [Bacteroidota bacterium]|nr:T9SS type A sorting domain-containing protein [Bacteroidota bacterium]
MKYNFIIHRYLRTALLCAIVTGTSVTAQPKFRIPITVTDSGTTLHSATAYFGVHPDATNCIDPDSLLGFTDHWSDVFLFGTPYTSGMIEFGPPPLPPAIDIRIASLSPSWCKDFLYANIQKYTDSLQVDTFSVAVQPYDSQAPDPMIYTVPSVIGTYCDSLVIVGSKFDNYYNVLINDRINLAHTNGRFVDYPTLAGDLLQNFELFLYHPKNPPLPPSTVQVTSPAKGANNVSISPTITWAASTQAQWYEYQIGLDSSFSTIIAGDTTSSTSQKITGLQFSTQYYLQVAVYSPYGMSYFQNPPQQFTTESVAGIKNSGHTLPHEYELSQNYPNPFNPSTTITYSLPQAEHVRLKVYNVFGQEMQILVDRIQPPGSASIPFDASNLPSGIYFYRLSAGRFMDTKKMTVIK